MRFLLLPMWKKAFLLRCLLIVAAMRIGLNVLRFDRLRKLTVSPPDNGVPDVDYLKRVAWGVSRAAAYVPGASCLTQALAGQYLLSRRGVASSIRLGVNRESGKALSAHAWLISGGYVVLGGESRSMSDFVHLADFGPAS
jgi:hypothetical protein